MANVRQATAKQLSDKYDLPLPTVKKALKNLNTGKARLLSLSGKMGSGKDTVAPVVLSRLKVDAVHEFFARPLKSEVNEIFDIIRTGESFGDTVEEVKTEMGITSEMSHKVVDYLFDVVLNDLTITSYDKVPNVRLALQYWGTEVRRSQDENYWVKKALDSAVTLLARGRSVYVTDVRFANEADAVAELGGIAVRLNISPEEQERRIFARDGVKIDEEMRSHASETSLDDYPNFLTSIFVDNLSVEQVVNKIMEGIKSYV